MKIFFSRQVQCRQHVISKSKHLIVRGGSIVSLGLTCMRYIFRFFFSTLHATNANYAASDVVMMKWLLSCSTWNAASLCIYVLWVWCNCDQLETEKKTISGFFHLMKIN